MEMSRGPFRGIYAEIAREKGISRQAIRQGVQKRNPEILRMVAEKIEERKRKIEKYDKAIESIKTSSTIKTRNDEKGATEVAPFFVDNTQ
ncbi:MAG: hypothetical protein JWQ98_1890 [Chlorobi bacterium]|nr:hypothetical protein [Chlorobiota bacterium]